MTAGMDKRASVVRQGGGLRVLVAEDNEVSRALAVRLLAHRGHETVAVGTGREAVAAWENGVFDLILMDLQMPQMDGIAATVAIREREKTTATYTPIIALTASKASTDEARCREAGMDAFLSKPVRVDAFFGVIADVLERGHASAAYVTPAAYADGEVLDVSAALEAVDGEREILDGMIAIFMRQTPRIVEDIDAAIAAGDASALENAAHKLKGSVAMFGARASREAAQQLEDLAAAGDLSAAPAARAVLGAEIDRLRAALQDIAEAGQ
jgi:two-component system sensor histidine kinase/response regulator